MSKFMTHILRPVLAGFFIVLTIASALAQAPQLGAGQVLGNSTAAQRPGRAEDMPAMFDRAFCATANAGLFRLSGLWSCLLTANNSVLATNGSGVPTYTTTLPSAVQDNITRLGTIANVGAAIGATFGGTGQSSYAVGDILYAPTTTTVGKLADVATGNAVISGGVGVAPSYGKVGLTTHVSGTLPIANGGTNASSASGTAVDNISGFASTGIMSRTGAGTYTFSTLTALMDSGLCSTRGNVIYRAAGGWSCLVNGASGTVLSSGGVGADPSWIASGGTGTVTNFTAGNLSPLFTTSVAGATTTPALTFTLSTASANTVFAGPTSGGVVAPTFRALVAADLGGAWTSYTPTIACSTGTMTSNTSSGRYVQYGKAVLIEVDVSVTNAGTCGGFISATFPFTAQSNTALASRDFNSGFSGNAWIAAATGTIQIQKYDGTAIVATGTHWAVGGVFEAQ